MPSGEPSAVPPRRPNGRGVRSHLNTAPAALAVELTDPPGTAGNVMDIVQEWGEQSFPASDPPANW
jgi:hypothetical protein